MKLKNRDDRAGRNFSAYNPRYQSNFVRARSYNACNPTPGASLKEAQRINESSPHKIIRLSLETRPDHITPAKSAACVSLAAPLFKWCPAHRTMLF